MPPTLYLVGIASLLFAISMGVLACSRCLREIADALKKPVVHRLDADQFNELSKMYADWKHQQEQNRKNNQLRIDL